MGLEHPLKMMLLLQLSGMSCRCTLGWYRDLPYRVLKHVDEVLWVILPNEVGDLDILVAALDEEENAQDQ